MTPRRFLFLVILSVVAAIAVLALHEGAHYIAAVAQGCDAMVGFEPSGPFGPYFYTDATNCPPDVSTAAIEFAPVVLLFVPLLILLFTRLGPKHPLWRAFLLDLALVHAVYLLWTLSGYGPPTFTVAS